MKQENITKLYELLCGQNTAQLALQLANGLGYTSEEFIELIWDKYGTWDNADIENLMLSSGAISISKLKNSTLYWFIPTIPENGGTRAGTKSEIINYLIKHLTDAG